MPADVGGRLEAVSGRRSLFGPDYLRLAVLAATALAVHGWLVAHTAVPARDALAYARVALNLADPNAGRDAPTDPARARVEVIRTAEQPPGFPAAVWAVEKLLRPVTDHALPDRVLLAAQLVNAAAAVLLVVPMYLTGRVLFGRNVGFAAALLFQVLPVPARVTSDGLSEGLYLLCVAAALLFAVRAVRRRSVAGCLLCGVAAGASYLVRPEGLLVGMAAGLVVAAAAVGRFWPRDAALGRLAALGVGVGLVAVPYAVLIGKLTNKPTGKYITTPLDAQPAPIWRHQPGANAGGAGPLFAEWWDPKRDDGKDRTVWAVKAVGKEMVKGLHYVVGGLALVGLVARRRQLFAPDPAPWVLVALGGLNLLLLVYLAARIGYVSERHTVLPTMVCCTFAAAALRPLADALGAGLAAARLGWVRVGAGGLLAALVAAALPYTLKPMHPQREGHKHAGRWLAGAMGPDDALVDPLAWAEWYAGRTLYRREHPMHGPVVWVVVERGKTSPHSRLPLWEWANELAGRGELRYRWPEAGAGDGPVVEVYRVTTPAGQGG